MKQTKKIIAIALFLIISIVNCAEKKDDKLLILGAYLLSLRTSSTSELFYTSLSSVTQGFTANSVTSNQKRTWAFNADKTVQTITNFANGVNAVDGAITSTVTNTYTGGLLSKSVVAATGSTAGTCTSPVSGNGSYTLDYSSFEGKNARIRKCTPGTTTLDSISDVVTYEGGSIKTQAVTYSVTVANNYYQAYTFSNGVTTDYKYFSPATTADNSRLSFGTETVVTDSSITSTTSTYTAGANKTKISDVVYTIAGGYVTRVLTSNFTAGVVTSSTLDVYAYTGNTSFTKKSYSAIGATVVTETSTAISSSANTYTGGLITRVENFNPTTGASISNTVTSYSGSNPSQIVFTSVATPANNACTAIVFNDAAKTVTRTFEIGTSICSGGPSRVVTTIIHDGLSTTNFNGFLDNIDRAITQAAKINFLGDTALRSGENQKIFAFLGTFAL